MKAKTLRDKSISDLQNELIALLKEQFNLRMQRGIGQAANANLFRQVRKNIARVKTIITEKEGSLS